VKADLDLIRATMTRQAVDPEKADAVLHEITRQLQEDQKDKPPRQKLQTCIMLADPEGCLAEMDVTGWVVKIPEDDSPHEIEKGIQQAAYAFNQTPKGRRLPVYTIGEAMEVIPGKFMKEMGIRVQTRTPVRAVVTDNSIPRE
jgi:hypothetical protein